VEKQLELAVLGKLQLSREGEPLTHLLPVKGQALLIYLAVTRQSYSRSALAGLLWGDMPEETARANLRLTLSRLREAIGDYLIVTRQTVGFDFDRPHRLDLAEFELYATAPEQNPLEHLRAALSLYRGDFLDDFQLPNAPDFESWALLERERLRQLAVKSLFYLSSEARQREAYGESIEFTRRILALEPWLEEAHQQLIWLLAQTGQRSAALAQYEQCCRLLSDELGVEPAPATVALYHQLKKGEFDPGDGLRQRGATVRLAEPTEPVNGRQPLLPTPISSAQALPSPHLTSQLTPFIGREAELAQIAELFARPDCRLLTLVGPGGVGKTRLALAAAEAQVKAFRDGVSIVPLVGIVRARADEAVDLLINSIADALDYTFSAPQPPRELLLNYIANKQMLLLLDNFEQLLSLSDSETDGPIQLLLDILQRAAGVKFLITSRERLKLKAEWVLDVAGLAYPPPTAPNGFTDYPAVRLFGQSARRIKPNFDLAAEAGAVSHICQVVQGYPLYLELAANWVRVLPCQEIAAKIAADPDILATTAPDVADRHRSLRAVLDHSWNLLSELEQQTFCRLSVFRDGLELEAAEQVAGADVAVLAGLVEKSLLMRHENGRYELHELLRQYGAERLAARPVEQKETEQHYYRYYAEFLEKRRLALENGPDLAGLAEIDRELGNIRAAWERLMAGEAPEAVAAYVEGLWSFYRHKGWFQEAVQVLNQACALPGASSLQQGRWRRQLGDAYYQMSRLATSETNFEQAMALLGRPLPKSRAGWLLLLLSQLLHQLLHRLLPARLMGSAPQQRPSLLEGARVLSQLGQIFYFAGDKLRALTTALYALNLAERAGASPALAKAYSIYGITTGTAGLLRLADYYSRLAHETAQTIDHLPTKAYVLEVTGLYNLGICRWAEMETAFKQAAALFDQLELRRFWAECSSLLGKGTYYRGNFKQARQYHLEVMASAQYRGDIEALHWALLGQIECALRLGQPEIEQVFSYVDRASALPIDQIDRTELIRFYGVLALAHLTQGDRPAAWQAAETGLRHISGADLVGPYAIEGYAGVAETFLTLWETRTTPHNIARTADHDLKLNAQQACRALHKFARLYPLGQTRAWLYQGWYEWLANRPAKAWAAWQKSLAAAERLKMPYDQGRAHYELGRHRWPEKSGADDRQRQDHLRRACEIFSQLNAAPDLARTNAALNEVTGLSCGASPLQEDKIPPPAFR
jgi:DNA-binding SARP family transcriptional activator/predicted ATPase